MANIQPLAPTDADALMSLVDELVEHAREDYRLCYDQTTSQRFEDAKDELRAAITKWGAQQVPAGYALVPIDPTYVNINQRCAEVMEWRRTGTLRGNALREYSEEHWAGHTHALQLAEQETAAQAMTAIAKVVAQPVVREPLTDEQIARIARSVLETPVTDEVAPAWELAVGIARAIERAHGITGGQHVGNVD